MIASRRSLLLGLGAAALITALPPHTRLLAQAPSLFVNGGAAFTIDATNIASLDKKVLLMQPGGGSGIVTIGDIPANLGPCEFTIIKDDATSQPVRINAPNIGGTLYDIGGLSFVGVIGYGESYRIAIDPVLGIRVVGYGNPVPGREFHRTFVPTSASGGQVYSIEWWCRNGIVRVNCAVNNLDAMIVLPDPGNLGFIAPGYGRSFIVDVARPDFGSPRSCSVFSTTGYGINNRPQSVPTPVAAGQRVNFEFDNAQWWAKLGGVYI